MVYLLQLLPTYILHFTYGFSLGYPSILIPQLKAENISSLCLDSTSEGLVVGLDYATTFLISLITGQAQSALGPLRMIQCGCLPIFLAWILMASANDLSTVYMSRILVGLGNGIVLSSVYSVEVAEAEKRGAVVMVELIFRCLGLISISITGTILHWKTISTLILPLPVLSFFYGFCLPESPMYKKLPSSQPDDKESHPLVGKAPVSYSMRTLVKRRDVWFPFLLCTVNLVGQQAGGLKILQGYQVSIFNDVYRSSEQGNPLFGSSFDYWASVWICFVRFFAALLATKFINKFRRRTIYLVTASISVVIQISLVFVIFIDSSPTHPWLPIFVISLLVFFVQIGPESFPNLICSEVFPSEVRSNGKGIMRAISSVFSFLAIAFFPTVKEAIGLDFTFLALSTSLFLCIPVMFLYMPEAKDLNLNYVSQFYHPISNVSYVDLAVNNIPGNLKLKERMENRMVMIRNSLGLTDFSVIAEGRVLLAEGLLRICDTGCLSLWSHRRHVLLFNDVLMLATVVTPNIVNIHLEVIPLNNVKLEEKSSSNSWTILHPDHDGVELEACSTEEKVWWIRHIRAQLVKLNQEIDISATDDKRDV